MGCDRMWVGLSVGCEETRFEWSYRAGQIGSVGLRLAYQGPLGDWSRFVVFFLLTHVSA